MEAGLLGDLGACHPLLLIAVDEELAGQDDSGPCGAMDVGVGVAGASARTAPGDIVFIIRRWTVLVVVPNSTATSDSDICCSAYSSTKTALSIGT
jgi:hypothetical protein